MKTNDLFSVFTPGAVFWLMLISPALAASPDAPRLSPAQVSVIAREIAKLKFPEERALAAGWTDAKKIAEFICRPLATKMLKRRFKNADRVFLGADDPKTLHLVSDSRLEGSGQVRTVNDWQAFIFICRLSPLTGKAVSFETSPSSANSTPSRQRYVGFACVDDFPDDITGGSSGSCTCSRAACAMIITEPNKFVAEVHDRMPVLLKPDQFERWLSGEAGKEILAPAPEDLLQKWLVSKRVNSARE